MTAQATTQAATPQQKIIPWWAVLIEGIAAIILGVLLLLNPAATTAIMIQFLGIYWFLGGILSIIRIFWDKSLWGWKLFAGLIGIVAGILILQHPLWSTLLVPLTLVWVFGFFGIVIGVVALIQAFSGGGWGIGILGVLSILFGIALMGNTVIGAVALPYVFGILGIVFGIGAIIGAFRLK
jgi:uncharacterized membrane protein HdeD (DUF308 family)